MWAGERMDIALAADDREAGKLGRGSGPYASLQCGAKPSPSAQLLALAHQEPVR